MSFFREEKLDQKSLLAQTWLGTQESHSRPIPSHQHNVLTSFLMGAKSSDEKNVFSPHQFLIPGWKGSGLISKDAIALRKVLQALCADAREQFNCLKTRNRSMKLMVYNEFISYAHHKELQCDELDGQHSFFEHLYDPSSPYRDKLGSFIDLYCFRAAVIYLLRIRFIIHLSDRLEIVPSAESLVNPLSFISKIFQKGSSSELPCESLQINQYSWYRPSSNFKQTIKGICTPLKLITITELMKICTFSSEQKGMEQLSFDDLEYSHSLSHLSFGLFINHLLLHIPTWIKEEDSFCPLNYMQRNRVKILNTKFTGNHLNSFTLSHWLAQSFNKEGKWTEVLSPEFIGEDFSNGTFLKLCHELKFITFLVELSHAQNLSPIELLCQVMRDKYSNSSEVSTGQMTMFSQYDMKGTLSYDRIILNLANIPKKNPHHFLIGKINSQLSSLKADGLLYVFSNQKLFVPSQSEKVEQLFQEVRLEVSFNFENLKGKGEIPSYLYIFKRRPSNSKQKNFYESVQHTQKESTLTFRWEGQLVQFNKFHELVLEFSRFLRTKKAVSTPIFQSQVNNDLSFEFHQDAILEGKLLSSSCGDKSNITHPNFFKNLTKACIPFEQFFYVESLNSDGEDVTSGLLGIKVKQEERYPIVLIVNYTNPRDIQLELIDSKSYRAKVEKYGMAFFQYFGLLPKTPDINLNVFREFFDTPVGHQIIQLSLNGGFAKLKSKVRALLVPKFFTQTKLLPSHIEKALDLYKMSEQQLVEAHPARLENSFTSLQGHIAQLSRKFPWQMMSILAQFKYNLKNALSCFDQQSPLGKNTSINYNNPLVKGPLLESPTSGIYPKNPDIYVDFKITSPDDIHLALTNVALKTGEDGSLSLELSHEDKVIVELFAEKEILDFVRFILEFSHGRKVSDLLLQIRVPALKDLKEILINFQEVEKTLKKIYKSTDQQISSILTEQITFAL